MNRFRIAYIAGCSHSGSTLLNRVIGAHEEVVNVGGLKNVPAAPAGRKKCSCRAPSLAECTFWSGVDGELAGEGLSLDGLRPADPDPEVFRRHNLALLQAIRTVSDAPVVVDSSRCPTRLDRLRQLEEVEVVPLFIYKDPRGQAASWKRRHYRLRRSVVDYWRRNLYTHLLLRRRDDALRIPYEHFCRDSAGVLKAILERLGVRHDPGILDRWPTHPTHLLGGNKSRTDQSAGLTIRLDERWRRDLGRTEKLVLTLACYPLYRFLGTEHH